ncbi:MAG: L,D-transpeptidase family protein [Kiritimatiellia bacterium]
MQLQPLDDFYRPSRPPVVTILVIVAIVVLLLAVLFRSCTKKSVRESSATAQTEETTSTNEPEATAESTAATKVAQMDPATPPLLTNAEFERAVADSNQLRANGKYYDARTVLLNALPRVDDTRRSTIETALGKLATEIYFTPRPGPDKVEYVIQAGDSLSAIASRFVCPKELIQKANGIPDPRRIRPGQRIVFPNHPKFHILVSKSSNTLVLSLNGAFFKRYVVSTGANAKTPAGTFKVVDKIMHPDWWTDDGKVIPFGDPKNILGTHWLALEATGETMRVSGYGIHGTWDDSSLGSQASAGCVRMRNAEVEEIFTLIPRGTPVTIVE